MRCCRTLAIEWLRSEGFRVGPRRATRGRIDIPSPYRYSTEAAYDLCDIIVEYGSSTDELVARINAWAEEHGHYGRAWGARGWPHPEAIRESRAEARARAVASAVAASRGVQA